MTRLQFSPAVLNTFEQQPITKRIIFNAISESYKNVIVGQMKLFLFLI